MAIRILILSLGFLAFIAACTPVTTSSGQPHVERPASPPRDVRLTEDDNGSVISLNAGDTLLVTLSTNPSTVYSWDVANVNESILSPAGQTDAAPGSGLLGTPRVGASSQVTFRFEAARRGQTMLSLEYRRPFEANVAPAQTFSVMVFID